MVDVSQVSRTTSGATALISQTLNVGSVGDQMKALMDAYLSASDREAFALALIGEMVVNLRRQPLRT